MASNQNCFKTSFMYGPSDCIGELRGLEGCMSLAINLGKVKKELGGLDLSDSDCSARLA